MYDVVVKSTNHVILNEVRMLLSKESPVGKNLSQLSTRFFVASLPQNDRFGSFYETIYVYKISKRFRCLCRRYVYGISWHMNTLWLFY